MNSRYIDPNIKFLMYKSSFLDPRFKTLAHLSTTLREEIFDCVLDECIDSESVSDCPDCEIESATDTESATSSEEPRRKKRRVH